MRDEPARRVPPRNDLGRPSPGDSGRAPLAGVRVVECGLAYAGPIATHYLAGLGAEVVTIDSRNATSFAVPPRWAEHLGPAALDLAAGADALNGGKLSLGLNLGHADARPILARLVATSDVFVTNLSVPALASLKLHEADVREWNETIIYASLTGFGTSPGPYRDYRSFGPTLSALSGYDSLTGDPDRDPVTCRTPYLDFLAAYHAVVAILHALDIRTLTGRGPGLELSQFSIAASALGPDILYTQIADQLPLRAGNRSPDAAPCGLFPCRGDDRWVSIEIGSDSDWGAFCEASGLHQLANDSHLRDLAGRLSHQDEIERAIAAWTGGQTSREVAFRLQVHGVAACPVQTGWDHLADPQLEARHYWRAVTHDRLGSDVASGLPMRFSATQIGFDWGAPSHGHDTDTVLSGLGLSPDDIDRLVEAGVAERETQVAAEFADCPLERPSKPWAWPMLGLTEPVRRATTARPDPQPVPAEPGDLTGCRILDLSDRLSVYGTRLLAMLGAEVVRVEPPEGAPLRRQSPPNSGVSTYHQFMDAGKRSMTLELGTEHGRRSFLQLVRTADVIYESTAVGKLAGCGLGWDQIHASNPRAVLVSVTSFGQSGPYAQWHAGELGLWALSGSLPGIGYPDRPPSVPRSVAPMLVGTVGAIATLAALRARRMTGEGEWIDVSAHETMVATAGAMLPEIERPTRLPRAGSQGAAVAPWGYFPCTDRLVSLMAVSARHWLVLASWIRDETGSDEGLAPDYLRSAVTRYEHGNAINELVASLTKRYAADEFCREAQRRGLPAVPLNSLRDLLHDPHLEAIGFWRPAPDGQTINWPSAPLGVADQRTLTPAPRLGADNALLRRD